tara:strand:- start:321 stop:542 length:222 start_codon:yes stop_codon:yes gene_type:complete
MNKKEIYESVANSGIAFVDSIFDKTVDLLIFLGKTTGLGYTAINVLIMLIVMLVVISSILLNVYFYIKLKKKR